MGIKYEIILNTKSIGILQKNMIIGAHVWPLSFLYHIIWIILLENVKCMFYVPLKTLQRTDILVGQVVNTSFLGWLKLILCTVMYAVIFNLISSIVDRYMFGKLLALEVSRANENWPRRWWMSHKGVLQGSYRMIPLQKMYVVLHTYV